MVSQTTSKTRIKVMKHMSSLSLLTVKAKNEVLRRVLAVDSCSSTGRPRCMSAVQTLERVLFVCRTGCQWSQLPMENGHSYDPIVASVMEEIAKAERGACTLGLVESSLSAEDADCAKTLFSLPSPFEAATLARRLWQEQLSRGEGRPLQDLYRELYGAVAAHSGTAVLEALGLPSCLQCTSPHCGLRLALSWPGLYDIAAGDDGKVFAVMEASQKRLELVQAPHVEDLRAVMTAVGRHQLARALVSELRGEVNLNDSLGFLCLLQLLTGDRAAMDFEGLLRSSISSHVAFMRGVRRNFGYQLAPETQQRVLREMLQQRRPIDRAAFLALIEELRGDLRPEVVDDFRRFEAYNRWS